VSSSARQLFSENVRKARLALNLSQEDLAERADLHRNYIGGVERGERNISLDNMEQLAKALETTIGTLLGEVPATAKPSRGGSRGTKG
jgi:transcriptional regulator with XRE-family HTH domain